MSMHCFACPPLDPCLWFGIWQSMEIADCFFVEVQMVLSGFVTDRKEGKGHHANNVTRKRSCHA